MTYEATIKNVLDQNTLRWIFCGGKGGVGKTTVSCSIAIQLAKRRESVLLISTDPAHNLSDAFDQKFDKDPKVVNGFDNLYAMEIDPSASINDLVKNNDDSSQQGQVGDMMQDLAKSLPGIDEAMSFAEVMRQLKDSRYSVVVFDTAPTGHTLRFMNFPEVLSRALERLTGIVQRMSPMISQLSPMLGLNNPEGVFAKIDVMKQTIDEVRRQFTDPELTTFICVCISEFLSLYETERMIQELTNFNIDTHNIVVNQLLMDPGTECQQCKARRKIQKKYLDEIEELYEDFHIIKLPQMAKEIRGPKSLKSFSEMLYEPYSPPIPL